VAETKTNRSLLIVVATFGVIFALSGMTHGLFEVLQGNTPTDALFISAIGEEHRMWVHGEEGAFTVIPNFLVTGILAIAVSVAIIVWSIGFLHTRFGPTVYLVLFLLLFLFGGGVAQALFFFIAWGFATRIRKPLKWWRRVLGDKPDRPLARIWPFTTVAMVIGYVVALAIAVFGYVPGMSDPDRILVVMVVFLAAGFVSFLLSCVGAAFADALQLTSLEQEPAVA
jgi:hypothetical protein